MTYVLFHRCRCRAFFSPQTTQHVRSLSPLREVARALASLAALAAWGGVIVLLGG
jgi:hypothetical protein